MSLGQPEPAPDEEQLLVWAIVMPVLGEHHSVSAVPGRGVSACACSPTVGRSTEQWARHVSDEIAKRIQ
jgi:hypothetical protein